MKKILSASVVTVLFAGVIALTSCKKDVTVTVKIADQEHCISATTANPQYGFDKTFEILMSDVQTAFSQAGVTFSSEKIKTAKFKNFKLKIGVSSTAINFDDISGAQVYAKTTPPTTGGADTELGQQVAYIDNIGNNTQEITMSLTGLELKSFLNEAKLYVTIRVYNESAGNDQICIKLTSGVIEIEAQK